MHVHVCTCICTLLPVPIGAFSITFTITVAGVKLIFLLVHSCPLCFNRELFLILPLDLLPSLSCSLFVSLLPMFFTLISHPSVLLPLFFQNTVISNKQSFWVQPLSFWLAQFQFWENQNFTLRATLYTPSFPDYAICAGVNSDVYNCGSLSEWTIAVEGANGRSEILPGFRR